MAASFFVSLIGQKGFDSGGFRVLLGLAHRFRMVDIKREPLPAFPSIERALVTPKMISNGFARYFRSGNRDLLVQLSNRQP